MSGKQLNIVGVMALLLCSAIGLLSSQNIAQAKEDSVHNLFPIQPQDLQGEISVKAGRPLHFSLVTQAGAYVKGYVKSQNNPVSLFLKEGELENERLLLGDVRGQKEFYFKAQSSQSILILKSDQDRDDVVVRVENYIPVEKQDVMRAYRRNADPDSPMLKQALAEFAEHQTTNRFWQEIEKQGTPLIEASLSGDLSRSLLTFLWRDAKHNVRIVGAPASDHIWMSQLGNTDIWFASFDVPNDVRLTYKLAPDVPQIEGSIWEKRVALKAVLQSDPLNSHYFGKVTGDPYTQTSYIALSSAPDQLGLKGIAEKKGRIETSVFASALLENQRDIDIYYPPHFDLNNPENVLMFMFDGKQYQDLVPVPAILDNLYETKKIPPVVTVFIDQIDQQHRGKELPCNEIFAQMMVQELLPDVLQRTGLKHNPKRTLSAGSSYGGLAAACLSARHPDEFGVFLSMSGSFWWGAKGEDELKEFFVRDLFAKMEDRKIKAFLSAGIFETSRIPSEADIFNRSRELSVFLKEQGHDVFFQSYSGGHDYAIWQGALGDGLINLFGKPNR